MGGPWQCETWRMTDMLRAEIVEQDDDRVVVEVFNRTRRVAWLDVAIWELRDESKVIRGRAGLPGGRDVTGECDVH